MPKHQQSGNRKLAPSIAGVLLASILIGVIYYYVIPLIPPVSGHLDYPTLHLYAKNNGVFVVANLQINWPNGVVNVTQTNINDGYFCQPVQLGHYSVTCNYQGLDSADSPFTFDLATTDQVSHTFNFGNTPPPPPPPGNANDILSFRKETDPVAGGWLVHCTQIQSLAFGPGGPMVKSGGVWKTVDWSGQADVFGGVGLLYTSGLVFYWGSNTQLIMQADVRPFLIFTLVSGAYTMPAIDGMQVSGSLTLAPGQSVVFYVTNKPTVGTYLSTDVESGSGFHVDIVTPETRTIGFNLNYGQGKGRITTGYSKGIVEKQFITVEYGDGAYRMPSFPVLVSGWWWRSYSHTGPGSGNGEWVPEPLAYSAHGLGYAQAYRTDTATTTIQGAGYVSDANYVYENGYWGWSLVITAYGSASNDQYSAYYTILYKNLGGDWYVRKYLQVHIIVPTNNMDVGADTTGMGLMTTSGLYCTPQAAASYDPHEWDWASGYTVKSTAYAYHQNAWSQFSFDTGYYTWSSRNGLDGSTGTRITYSTPNGDVHVYTKFVYCPSSGTEEFARYFWHLFLNHYFSSWADTQLGEGNSMGVEERFSTSDNYDSSVSAPTTQPSSFYLGFFP